MDGGSWEGEGVLFFLIQIILMNLQQQQQQALGLLKRRRSSYISRGKIGVYTKLRKFEGFGGRQTTVP